MSGLFYRESSEEFSERQNSQRKKNFERAKKAEKEKIEKLDDKNGHQLWINQQLGTNTINDNYVDFDEDEDDE